MVDLAILWATGGRDTTIRKKIVNIIWNIW